MAGRSQIEEQGAGLMIVDERVRVVKTGEKASVFDDILMNNACYLYNCIKGTTMGPELLVAFDIPQFLLKKREGIESFNWKAFMLSLLVPFANWTISGLVLGGQMTQESAAYYSYVLSVMMFLYMAFVMYVHVTFITKIETAFDTSLCFEVDSLSGDSSNEFLKIEHSQFAGYLGAAEKNSGTNIIAAAVQQHSTVEIMLYTKEWKEKYCSSLAVPVTFLWMSVMFIQTLCVMNVVGSAYAPFWIWVPSFVAVSCVVGCFESCLKCTDCHLSAAASRLSSVTVYDTAALQDSSVARFA